MRVCVVVYRVVVYQFIEKMFAPTEIEVAVCLWRCVWVLVFVVFVVLLVLPSSQSMFSQ